VPIVLAGSLSLLFISGAFIFNGLAVEYLGSDYLSKTLLPVIQDYFNKLYEKAKVIFGFFEGMCAYGYFKYKDKVYLRFTVFDLNKTPYNALKNFVDYVTEEDFYLDVLIPFFYNDVSDDETILENAGVPAWGTQIFDKFGEVTINYDLPTVKSVDEKRVQNYKIFKEKNENLKKVVNLMLLNGFSVSYYEEDNNIDDDGIQTRYILNNSKYEYDFTIALNKNYEYTEFFVEKDLVSNVVKNQDSVIPAYLVYSDVVHTGWEKEHVQANIKEVTGEVALKLSNDSVLKLDVSALDSSFLNLKIDENYKLPVYVDENEKINLDVSGLTIPEQIQLIHDLPAEIAINSNNIPSQLDLIVDEGIVEQLIARNDLEKSRFEREEEIYKYEVEQKRVYERAKHDRENHIYSVEYIDNPFIDYVATRNIERANQEYEQLRNNTKDEQGKDRIEREIQAHEKLFSSVSELTYTDSLGNEISFPKGYYQNDYKKIIPYESFLNVASKNSSKLEIYNQIKSLNLDDNFLKDKKMSYSNLDLSNLNDIQKDMINVLKNLNVKENEV
jgi:hypothetical protein